MDGRKANLVLTDPPYNVDAVSYTHLGLSVSVVVGSEKERLDALEKKASVYVINRENVVWLCEKQPAHISEEGWHTDTVFIRNRFYHKVWRIYNVSVSSHEYRTTGNGRKYLYRDGTNCSNNT